MSIQNEINRIINKRDQALTKVASKGVTVPSGSTIDDLPSLIDLIEVEQTYSISKTLSNVTSSNNDEKVIAGGSFYADLVPTSGYAITNIVVTMGGVDITEQVFKPGVGGKGITGNGVYSASDDALSGYDRVVVNVTPNLGTKNIVVNGTYIASDDSLDGYSSVTVNVPTGGDTPELQSKTVTYTPNTSTQTETIIADTGYDGLSSVGVTINPIPSEYVIPSGTKSITENGIGIDVSAYAAVDVAVPTGGGSGDPVIGLITEITIESGATTISYNLSDINLSYGMLWAIYENVTYSSDYMYAGVVSSTGTPGDSSGYKSSGTSYNGTVTIVFRDATTANGISLPGIRGAYYSGNSATANRITTVGASYKFSRFVSKLYKSSSSFSGGTIKLYGRIA